jgi:hypothetical protein
MGRTKNDTKQMDKSSLKKALSFIVLLFGTLSSFSATYYSNSAELSNLNNWWTINNGTGTHPANFTTSGDIFQVQASQSCPVNSNWTLGNGVNIDVYGTMNVTGSATLTLSSSATSTIRIAIKSGGTFSNQSTGTFTFNGAISIENGGTWSGSGSTGNTININGAFTNSSTSQTDNSTATYVFTNVGPLTFNSGLGMNVYNFTSTGLNNTFSGKWYVRNALSTGAFQMNASAEMYIYGTFSSSGDWSHSVSSSTVHYAASIPLVATQYGCKVQIDKGITVTLASGNFFNNADFVLDTNSTVNISGTGTLQYLHFVTMNAGSTLYINNGTVPNNFNTYTNVYSPTSTFRFGNNGASYTYLLYSDKQTFGKLVLDDASSSSTVSTFNANTTITGDLTIGTNVTFQPWTGFQYDLTIGGNLINNGTVTTSATTIKNVTFNGSSAQSIGGSSTTTFYNLIINNTSSTSITLNKPAIVTNALILTDGFVYSSTSNILTINSGATSSIGSDASHVEGPMKKIGNTAFTFPLGKSSYAAQLAFTPTTGFDVTTEISAEYFKTNSPNASNLGSGVHNVSKIEYWDITRVSDPSNDAYCNVTLYFNNKTRSGIASTGADIRTVHYESALWTDKGGSFHDNGDGSGYITSTTALTSYSPETIASTNGGSSLPIELSSFKVSKTGKNVKIKWTTQTETNNNNFELERSIDGEIWETLYICNGAGTTTTLNNYMYLDENPLIGVNYYRLKQTDFDGKSSNSSIESVKIENDSLTFIVYPNPGFLDDITILLKSNCNEIAPLSIIDINGQTICTGSIEILNSPFFIKLSDFCNVKAGTYFFSIKGKSFFGNTKIIIK